MKIKIVDIDKHIITKFKEEKIPGRSEKTNIVKDFVLIKSNKSDLLINDEE